MMTTRSNFVFSSGQFLSGLLMVVWLLLSATAFAQAPAASGDSARPPTAAELDQLVGPIALYPDDLVAIILPGSTYPVQIIQADRYLEKMKVNKDLPVDESWHDSVKSLLNYPGVLKKMSMELDWSSDLGEAVVTDQGAVLEAVQRFRRKVHAAGNLTSDDKQTVTVENEIIQVVQTNPEVIYIPQYDPATVVVAGYPYYGYYPAPYPVYYYPYAPGAAFATGLIWGAAITAAWHGGHYVSHYGHGEANINIDRDTNINIDRDRNKVEHFNRDSRQGSTQRTAWKSEKKPGQVSGQPGRRMNSARVGDASNLSAANGLSGGARTSNQPGSGPGVGLNDRASSSGQFADRNFSNQSGDAFSNFGSGREARADSSRGLSSRQSMSSSGRGGQSFQGGARAGGGMRMPMGGGRGGRR